VVYSHNEYYSTLKRNEVLIDATTWMDLKNTMLNERKPVTKDCMVLFHEISTIGI
jgi:hypothetical protein